MKFAGDIEKVFGDLPFRVVKSVSAIVDAASGKRNIDALREVQDFIKQEIAKQGSTQTTEQPVKRGRKAQTVASSKTAKPIVAGAPRRGRPSKAEIEARLAKEAEERKAARLAKKEAKAAAEKKVAMVKPKRAKVVEVEEEIDEVDEMEEEEEL